MLLMNHDRARRLLAEAGIDVLVATSADNVRYLSDYECISHKITPSVLVFGVLEREGEAGVGLIVPSLEVDAWAEQPSGVCDVTAYGTLYRESRKSSGLAEDDARIFNLVLGADTSRDALRGLRSMLERRSLTSAVIGIDESGLDYRAWEAITTLLPQAKIVPAAALFRKIRMVKTSEEIRRLERSALITEEAIRSVYDLADAGVTERQLIDDFKAQVSRLGGTPQFWVICGGRRTGHTHPRPSDYALRHGDLLKLDVGCTYQGYWSDIGRTRALGNATQEQRAIHRAVLAGLRSARETIRPGIRSSEVFDAAVEAVRASGVETYSRHHCGHGIGISIYDPPVIQPSNYGGIYGLGDEDTILEAGMVLNLETPFYLLGEFGFIVEDTFVVEENGARAITTLDHAFDL